MSDGIKCLRRLRRANFWASSSIDLIVNVRSDANSRHASSERLEMPIDSPTSFIDSFVAANKLFECVVAADGAEDAADWLAAEFNLDEVELFMVKNITRF